MIYITPELVVEEFKQFLDKFLILDDFEKDDVFSKMRVPEIRKVLVLMKYLEDFKKMVNWKLSEDVLS